MPRSAILATTTATTPDSGHPLTIWTVRVAISPLSRPEPSTTPFVVWAVAE